MITIPVMTDATVVRRHTNAMAAPAASDDAMEGHMDAAVQDDHGELAAGGGASASNGGAYGGSSSGSHSHAGAFHHYGPSNGNGGAIGRPPVFGDGSPAYFSAAVPCAHSILDVGPAPAAIAAPVDVAPPEMPPLAQYCALALQHRCDRSQELDQNFRSCFHSSRVPSISLWDYVRRFAKYSICSEECFIVAMVLMDRYVCRTRVPITLRNVHRLYITAMTLSVKLRDDSYYSNAYYASIGGVLNGELNVLELELLDTVQWFTWVERSVYDAYIQRLEALYYPAMPQQAQVPAPRRN